MNRLRETNSERRARQPGYDACMRRVSESSFPVPVGGHERDLDLVRSCMEAHVLLAIQRNVSEAMGMDMDRRVVGILSCVVNST